MASEIRPGRVLAVTAGLIVTGAIAGALAGGAALALCMLVTPGFSDAGLLGILWPFWVGAVFGAPLGAIAAPVLAFLLLRHVPLGKMFFVCAAGTMGGGIAGWFAAAESGNIFLIPLLGAFLGCVMTAVLLRLRQPLAT